LSVKAATSTEAEALRQFADDWAMRIGHGASIQIPTYSVLAHGIRTSTMDMNRFEDNRSQILQDNRPFIPQAEIRHIGWLTAGRVRSLRQRISQAAASQPAKAEGGREHSALDSKLPK
jgi:hypothetical protein